jgi:MYXO-CTERM domain-containing protein
MISEEEEKVLAKHQRGNNNPWLTDATAAWALFTLVHVGRRRRRRRQMKLISPARLNIVICGRVMRSSNLTLRDSIVWEKRVLFLSPILPPHSIAKRSYS